MRVHGGAGGNLAKEKKLVKVKLHFLDSLPPAHELVKIHSETIYSRVNITRREHDYV